MLKTFCAGAALYPAIELLWRGRTHAAMGLAGGVALCALKALNDRQKKRPLWLKALEGGLLITGIEYGFGLLFNRRHRIWDYRRVPLNLRGQVCAPYTLAWCGLSALALMGFQALEER